MIPVGDEKPMITYKCENCGGEMVIRASGDLVCDYCGSKSHFSDAQLREYREFRKNMLEYLLNTRNHNSIRLYLYLLNKYLWKENKNENYCFTIVELAKAIGY